MSQRSGRHSETRGPPGDVPDRAERSEHSWAALHIPGFNIGAGADGRLGETVAVSDQTSMAKAILAAAEPGRWTVIQRGPRRLWDTIEHATRLWEALGRPGRDRFGITALDRTDRQFVWLDDPDGPYSWPLPL